MRISFTGPSLQVLPAYLMVTDYLRSAIGRLVALGPRCFNFEDSFLACRLLRSMPGVVVVAGIVYFNKLLVLA